MRISDKLTPVALLWGPCCIGKTMVLKRLFKSLRENGYSTLPDYIFHPANKRDEIDKYFKNLLADVPFATYLPMLSKVFRNGRPICQFVDLPGYDCFDPTNVNIHSQYISQLLCVPNKKIFVIFVELDRDDNKVRSSYVNTIIQLSHCMSQKDQVIFVVPKIDKMLSFQTHNIRELFTLINMQYPTLFEYFATRNPIIKLFKPYRFDFIAFSAGEFGQDPAGNTLYVEGKELFPQRLWQAFIKTL